MGDLASRVLSACRARGWTLATAESCTGGLVAAALTKIPGSSDVVDRGFVTYSNAAKIQMLGVLPDTLDTYGAVSVEIAQEMSEGALAAAGTDLAISITGIAGPGPSEHKPEGRVCFSVAQKKQPTCTELLEFGAIGRDMVRVKSTEHALNMLLDASK